MAFVRPQSANRMLAGLFIAAATFSAGCRQTSSEYVEAELRVQSRKVADLENRLAQRDAELETLRHTVTTFQAAHVKPADAPESVYRDTALSRISLTLATGGKDADVDGKDDGVVVGVAPHDYDGDVFKCPGSCRLQLFETNPSGSKRQIGEWVVSSDQVRGMWRTSLLGQGYHLAFPWQSPPSERRLKAVLTFTTLDGRKFDAEKEFDVSLQAKSPPRMPGAKIESEVPLVPPTPSAPMSNPMSELPKPRGLGALSSTAPRLEPRVTPPAAKAAADIVPPPARAVVAAKPTTPKPASPWDGEHSPPPLFDTDLRGTVGSQTSPGDQADAEDVIVLPVSAAKAPSTPSSATIVPVEPKVVPSSIVAPKATPAKPEAPDRIALPDEPPPPKSATKYPTTIALPN